MRVYADYNATTPLAPGFEGYLRSFLGEGYKNPSSIHAEGRAAREFLDRERTITAGYLGAEADQVIYTSGATEANNAVLQSFVDMYPDGKIILSGIEHDSVYKKAQALGALGYQVVTIPVDEEGKLDVTLLDFALQESPALVSVMLANNETGMVLPIVDIAAIAHEAGSVVHTDATCALGKIPLLFNELDVDYLSFSAHKCYGLKGVGGLLVKDVTAFKPQILGGLHERGNRAGTENLIGIMSLNAGLKYGLQDLGLELQRMEMLRSRFVTGLKTFKREMKIHESSTAQLASTVNIAFRGFHAETMLARLDLEGVAVSFGSACHSGTFEPSRVLLNMGISEEEASSTIRFSFGRMTTIDEIDFILGVLKKTLEE
ncbi:cysteine desulfurase [bacterium]|nr:cysteine desulfurase [bacterium]